VTTSLWQDQAGTGRRRDALEGRLTADVVVVGAGLTGLWTAYYLAERDPSLAVVVLEAEHVGFGASGRNGGWCSALFPTSAATLARRHGGPAATAMRAAMRETVREVGRVCTAESIDCGFSAGGTLALARTPVQLARARAEAEEARRWGDEVELLDAEAARSRLAASDVLGATWTPDCARIQPLALVRGLADAVEARGVTILEGSRVVDIEPGRVRTEHGSVRARHVLRATEAWTATLPGSRRAVAPVYSLMIATEPLDAATWQTIGLHDAETFTDERHLIIYGQRTVDDRIAFGGRGAPYHWGSAIRPGFDAEPAVFAALERTLHDLLPQVRGAQVTHRWGGPLGIARDWHASVELDRVTGLGSAGGYVGDGVGTTNLAGRTLADLVLGLDTPLVRLPWAGHRSPRWEPEPLRWLGINAGLRAMALADAEERLTGRSSLVARATAPLIGG
jgi:glycine/D-amino acid oxidase-like deaminating enzyme